MVRRLSLAVALALGVAPFGVRALGLGDIELNSSLNQYLNADIELLSANVDELDGIQVNLGSPEAFERAGVDRNYQLTYLTFKAVLLPDGSPIIKVASREPVREPFLNFIVEMNWPKGRLIREYTLLLDPPVTIDRRPPPVAAARLAPKPTVARTQRAPARSVASSVASGSDTYPVRRSDTLWAISKRVRHPGATLSQTMISLLHANPQAFINQDINRLKAGQILRVPSREEMLTLAAAEAETLYRASVAGTVPKRAAQPEPEQPAGEQPEQKPLDQQTPEQASIEQVERAPETETETVAAETAQETAEAAPEAELKIAAAEPESEASNASVGVDAGAAEKTAEELQQDLALAQEAKETAKIEGEELRSRVSDLEAQLEDMKRLLALKSEQLASMQDSVAAGEAPVAQSDEPVADSSAAAVEEEKAVADEETTAEPAPVAVMEKAEEPATAPKPEKQSLVDRLMNDTTAMGGAIAAVVVLFSLLWVMIRRRRSSSADFQESILVNTVDESEAETMSAISGSRSQDSEDTSFLSDFSASDIDALQDETGEVDPIAEADVYIAYGRYRQAEELIRQAIERDPGRADLVFKLFDILSATRDRAAFVGLAEQASSEGLDQRDADGWQRVLEMGAALASDHPLFAGIEVPADSGEEGLDLDLDIDLRNQAGDSGSGRRDETAPYDIGVSPLAASDAGSKFGSSSSAGSAGEGELSSEFDELEIPSSAPKGGASAKIDSGTSAFDFEFDAGEKTEESSRTARGEGVELDLSDSSDGLDEIPSVMGGADGSADEVNTKLDLARAYVEMGDEEDAREILQEVIAEGDDDQRREAEEILSELP